MKIIQYIILGVGTLFGLVILSGFVWFMSQPTPPEAIVKISGSDWNMDSEFHNLDKTFWSKEGDKLVFENLTNEKHNVLLYASDLPSENKKPGYITASVKISGAFDAIDDEAIWGFQLGEREATNGTNDQNHLIMGVNGKGEVVVVNGELASLKDEKIKRFNDNLDCDEELELSFHYYQNPYGWVIFFKAQAQDDACKSGATINYIPFEKLDSDDKDLSLFVYNPSGNSTDEKIWFKDWRIQNDWTPND